MGKFFLSKENIQADTAVVSGDDVVHIRKVLRKKPGDELLLCDSEGMDFKVIITDMFEDRIHTKIVNSCKSTSESKISVTLFQALPKLDKMDYIVMKTTELGISKIVPISTKYTVAKINDNVDKKVMRWNKIAKEAAKQSMRSVIPEITDPISFEEAILMSKDYDLSIIPYELESSNRLKSVLNGHPLSNKIAVYIGSEGGFHEQEILQAKENGIESVTLGKRILRTETAGSAVMSMLLYAFDEI